MLYFLDNCTNLIRTIKVLQHDETNQEDLDTDGEDHAADSLRYGCMARPYTIDSQPTPPPELVYPARPDQMTINQLVQRNLVRLQAEREEMS